MTSSNVGGALALADRVIAKAGAVKAAARTAKASARSTRRGRSSARVSLAPVRLGRDEAIEPIETRIEDPAPWWQRDPDAPLATAPATINRRVDLLQQELANKRIDEAQFRTGRIVQAVFEKAMGRVGGGGWNIGGSSDAWTTHELAVIRGLETAEQVRAIQAKIERAVGMVGARMLRRLLVDRVSLQDYADERGKGSEHGRKMVAAQFRFLLEDVAEAWAARGASRSQRDADPWTEERRSTDLLSDTLVRGERSAPLPGEEVDVAGVRAPPGKGYRVGADPGNRWVPDVKRRRLERQASRARARA